jgi:hypothetical protein
LQGLKAVYTVTKFLTVIGLITACNLQQCTFKNSSMCKLPNGLTFNTTATQIVLNFCLVKIFWQNLYYESIFKIIKFSREIKKTLSHNNPFSWKISKFFVPRCSLLPSLFYTLYTNICIHIGRKLFLPIQPMWCPWKKPRNWLLFDKILALIWALVLKIPATITTR